MRTKSAHILLAMTLVALVSLSAEALAGTRADGPTTAVKPKPLSESVKRGVAWLAAHQLPSGGWGPGEGRGGPAPNEQPSVGDTCMAVLALLRAGNTPEAGRYARNVNAGIKFVCIKIEKSDADSLYVTDQRNTRIQSKLGTYIDTFLAGTTLADVQVVTNDQKLLARVTKDLEKVLRKIEKNLQADGTLGRGRAGGLQQAMAVKAINRAAQAGNKVDESVREKAAAHPSWRFSKNPASVGSMHLYMAAALLAAQQESVNTNAQLERRARYEADAATTAEQRQAAQTKLKRYEDAEKDLEALRAAVIARIGDKRFLAGAGSMGGEEYLSYVNIGESLVFEGQNAWRQWDQTMSGKMSTTQNSDGSWSGYHCITGRTFCTSGALLVLMTDRMFVAPGPGTLIFNKLKFNGDWNNRPRCLTHLTQWLSKKLETELHWQTVTLEMPPEMWHEAPILYISGAKNFEFSEEDLAKLRRYVWQGGVIFSVTEGGGMGFRGAIRKYYEKLFPDYELTACEKDHRIYSICHKLDPARARFHVITNGIRPLVIHTDRDLARSWQSQRTLAERAAFQAAVNVCLYATDRSLRAPDRWTWPAEQQDQPRTVIKLARIKFDGNWDPEPLGYERFSRLMGKHHEVKVEVIPAVPADGLALSGAKIATLTGTGSLALSYQQQKALREFVLDGGLLVMDAAGGDTAFDRSAKKVLKKMFKGSRLRRLEDGDRLLALEHMEIDKVKYRGQAKLRPKDDRINLRALMVDGRPGVIYSSQDITAALVGYTWHRCDGYAPESAFEIMRNIVTYAEGEILPGW
ncbi:MAG: DUF4159 domain-containing protein [Planctomycetota bacterium]|jgi:hypothetical protein